MKSAHFDKIMLGDYAGNLLKNVTDKWLIGLYDSNPALLDIFRERDIEPYRDLLPWSGESAGKYITGAYFVYRISKSEELKLYIGQFVEKLISYIDADGYLGCYQKKCHLTGAYSQTPDIADSTWDAWSHYHILYGLYLWKDEFSEIDISGAIERIVNCFLNSFYSNGRSFFEVGSVRMNLAVIHFFALLYRDTGKEEYRIFLNKMLEETHTEEAGAYVEYYKKKYDFYEFPTPRWESIPVLRGFLNLPDNGIYSDYKKAAYHIFGSIIKTDVHNTGAFSTSEQAIGSPCIEGVIELCAVTAFEAFCADMLQIKCDPLCADLLETMYYNAVLGSFSPSGRWCTYDTPMNGYKVSSCVSLNYQLRPGSPEINSDSAWSAYSLGLLGEWMLLEDPDTLTINYYGNYSASFDNTSLEISGNYITEGKAVIKIATDKKLIRLRIPEWAVNTVIRTSKGIFNAKSGTYFDIDAKAVTEIRITFNPCIRLIKGTDEFKNKYSVFYGPILYGFDSSDNPGLKIDKLPILKADLLSGLTPEQDEHGMTLIRLPGGTVLRSFSHIGSGGSKYITWLNIR